MEVQKKVVTPSVSEIFSAMSYGPAPESDKVAKAWLDEHGRKFGHFINNKWYRPEGRTSYTTKSPADGNVLADTIQGKYACADTRSPETCFVDEFGIFSGNNEDVSVAVKAAADAYPDWSALPGHARARYIYSIARHVQKHSRLISVIEALDNGKSIRETRDADIPVVVRHLYHYAGWAELMDTEMPEWKSIGVVGAIVPWNFPLMLLTWKVAPALAMGNTVVLKPATVTRLSALLFAEICAEAGLPPGVFNVITGGGRMGQALAEHEEVDKVGFTGSTEIGKVLRKAIAGTGKKISLELGGKSPVIVYENADLDSAVESVVDAIWFNQGQVCSAGSRLFVQEPAFNTFVDKLKSRLSRGYRIGHSLDKAVDMGAIVNDDQLESIKKFVDEAKEEGADVFQTEAPEGCFYPPTLITGVNTASKVVMEEIFGPVLVAMPFRTAKEAIALANNTMYGLAGSVHSEQLPLALETAKHIKAGTVWINCHNLFDAAAGFGGYKQSGYGRDGGKEGLYEYVMPKWMERVRNPNMIVDIARFAAAYAADGPDIEVMNVGVGATPKIDHTYKVYYGGAQKRPDGNYSKTVRNNDGYAVAQVITN